MVTIAYYSYSDSSEVCDWQVNRDIRPILPVLRGNNYSPQYNNFKTDIDTYPLLLSTRGVMTIPVNTLALAGAPQELIVRGFMFMFAVHDAGFVGTPAYTVNNFSGSVQQIDFKFSANLIFYQLTNPVEMTYGERSGNYNMISTPESLYKLSLDRYMLELERARGLR